MGRGGLDAWMGSVLNGGGMGRGGLDENGGGLGRGGLDEWNKGLMGQDPLNTWQ
jgi:hypothetical protein